MKEFVLPKLVKSKNPSIEIETSDNEYLRRVHFPANSSLIKGMKVGDEVEVMVMGTVVEVSSRANDRRDTADFTVDADKIKLHDGKMSKEEKAISDLADDEDS